MIRLLFIVPYPELMELVKKILANHPEREKVKADVQAREFDTSKLKRIPQSLETGLFFVKFLFLLYSNI